MNAATRHVTSKLLLAAGLALGVLVGVARAHGPLDASIAEVSKLIVESPQDGALRLRRGELHRLHEDWTAALDDYDLAEQLLDDPAVVDACRTQLYLDMAVPERALRAADRALEAGADPGAVGLLRAQALVALQRPVEAAPAYDRALAVIEVVRPDDVLDAARCHRAVAVDDERTEAERAADALACLERGLTRTGPCASLELAALDTEVELERWAAALQRIDRLMAPLARKESWLIRRAEVLERAYRIDEALAAYRAAHQALNDLPAAVRRRRQTERLAETCDRALARLAPSGESP